MQFTDASTTLQDRLIANVDPTTVTAGPQVPFTGDIGPDVMSATVSGTPANLTDFGTRGTDILMEGKDVTSSLLAPPDVSDITNVTLEFPGEVEKLLHKKLKIIFLQELKE